MTYGRQLNPRSEIEGRAKRLFRMPMLSLKFAGEFGPQLSASGG